jgi:hypothetical protein
LADQPKVIQVGEPTGKGRELEIIAADLTFKVTMIARWRHDGASHAILLLLQDRDRVSPSAFFIRQHERPTTCDNCGRSLYVRREPGCISELCFEWDYLLFAAGLDEGYLAYQGIAPNVGSKTILIAGEGRSQLAFGDLYVPNLCAFAAVQKKQHVSITFSRDFQSERGITTRQLEYGPV